MRQTLTIALDEIKQSLKNKKVLFLLFVYVALLVFGISQSVSFAMNFRLILIQVFGFYGKSVPYTLVLFYFMSIFLLPVFSLLLSYDCISKEIHKETIRNLVVAAKRNSIVLGKFLGIFLINITINFLIYIIAVFYIFQKTGEYVLFDGFLLWLFLSIYSLYFVALSVMTSSLTSNPQRSLYLGLIANALPLFFISTTIGWLSPYKHYVDGFYLLTDSFGRVFSPLAILIVSAAIFIAIALMAFKRREL